MIPVSESCCFCDELTDQSLPALLSGLSGLGQRVLYCTKNFFVIPTVSPLALGHLMILPTRHVQSLFQLPPDLIREFYQLKLAATKSLAIAFDSLLGWEHGVGAGSTGGCGVVHAHFHLLPLASSVVRSVHERLLLELPSSAPVASYPGSNLSPTDTYLWWDARQFGEFVAKDVAIQSQLVRRIVCSIRGSQHWDWRDLNNWEMFRETYRMFTQEMALVSDLGAAHSAPSRAA